MMEMIMVPGIGGSGPAHWQSLWEAVHPGIRRIRPASWDQPDLADWMSALEKAVAASPSPPVLIGHSLGCLLIAHWQQVSQLKVTGAMLVAVPDPQSAAFPPEAAGFAQPPRTALRFKNLMVASSDDPYGTLPYARSLAQDWSSQLIEIGAFGHINGQSGLEDWPAGWALLESLMS